MNSKRPEDFVAGVDDIVRKGMRRYLWGDLYHLLLTISWPRCLALTAAFFVLENAAFAGLYLLQPGAIESARPGSFADAFFFSVQTLGTIGYGVMHPATVYANVLMTAEVLAGLMSFALVTGIMFARFARPTARVMFSRVVVVAPFHGKPTLMFRCANERRNRILEAEVRVAVLRAETTPEGEHMRRYHDLVLLRSRTPVFSLGWVVMHPIDERSPLYGATAADLERAEALIVVTFMGLDETFAQTVYARHRYRASDIRWQHRFHDVSKRAADGSRIVDYADFHETSPLQPPPAH